MLRAQAAAARGGREGLVPRSSLPKSHPGRQWTMADAKRVLEVRREMPWAGKVRIAPELAERRPGGAPSEATVGRILRWAVETGRRSGARSAKGGPSARPPGGSAPAVFQRHGAHRQGVPGRCRGAARHPRRAGGRRSSSCAFMALRLRGRVQGARPAAAGAAPRSPQLNGTAVLHRRSEAAGGADPGSAGAVAIDCRHGCVIRLRLPTPTAGGARARAASPRASTPCQP